MIRALKVVAAAAATVVALGIVTATTASNSIGSSRLAVVASAITPDSLKPAACAGVAVSNLVTGSTNVGGTNGSDLILASAGADSITAGNGPDCVVAGGGIDVLNGGNGSDVCLGGPETDTFLSCETQVQ